MSPIRDLIVSTIQRAGPLTFDRFMDLSLYHPQHGYYAQLARRTGRAGDYLTSVDVGPVFGELLARQLAEMHATIGRDPFDLVESAAANGQLMRDVLDALARHSRPVYDVVRAHLVETSAVARSAHRAILGPHVPKLVSSSTEMPDRVQGVILANELLDALPCHAVVMRREGLREIVVDLEGDRLVEREAPPSTPELARYFTRLGVTLRPGWRAEVNLRALAWVRDAARRLTRGFLLLLDYGHRAAELYSASHSAGTRASYSGHVVEDAETAAWLTRPGRVDITAHVDLTSIENAARDEGLTTVAMIDQTYFMLGLGVDAMLASRAGGRSPAAVKRRLALKTLMLPGGMGSTLKVMIFGRGVGTPPLVGCSKGMRLT